MGDDVLLLLELCDKAGHTLQARDVARTNSLMHESIHPFVSKIDTFLNSSYALLRACLTFKKPANELSLNQAVCAILLRYGAAAQQVSVAKALAAEIEGIEAARTGIQRDNLMAGREHLTAFSEAHCVDQKRIAVIDIEPVHIEYLLWQLKILRKKIENVTYCHSLAKDYYQGRHNAISLLTATVLTTTFTCRQIGHYEFVDAESDLGGKSGWGFAESSLAFAGSMLLYLQATLKYSERAKRCSDVISKLDEIERKIVEKCARLVHIRNYEVSECECEWAPSATIDPDLYIHYLLTLL